MVGSRGVGVRPRSWRGGMLLCLLCRRSSLTTTRTQSCRPHPTRMLHYQTARTRRKSQRLPLLLSRRRQRRGCISLPQRVPALLLDWRRIVCRGSLGHCLLRSLLRVCLALPHSNHPSNRVNHSTTPPATSSTRTAAASSWITVDTTGMARLVRIIRTLQARTAASIYTLRTICIIGTLSRSL